MSRHSFGLLPPWSRKGTRFMVSLLAFLVLAAVLGMQAARAPACIGSDGRIPPWGGSGPNGIIVEQINKAYADAKAKGLETPTIPPISGNHPTVIILIENAGAGAPFNPAFSSAALWSARLAAFDSYYNQVSKGILRITAAQETYGTVNDGVIGPLTVAGLNATTDITLSPSASSALAAAAIKAANPYINFAAYDKNNDGKIVSTELHILIYQAGDESSLDPSSVPRAWAHTMWISSGLTGVNPTTDSDGKVLTSYCYCGSEFFGTYMATQGPMTHELGHDIGLPDLYDTDNAGSGGLSGGVGLNCLMSAGSWGGFIGDTPSHINAYHKKWLGWGFQDTVAWPVSQTRTLSAANGSNQSLRINIAGSQEFFVVENRQQTGFDAGLPETNGGLIIYHCDGAILNSGGAINNNPSNMGLKVEEADGLNQIGLNLNHGDDKDYYRQGNNTTFNDASNPNSRLKNGASSTVAISNISASGAAISLTLGTGSAPPAVTALAINNGAASTTSKVVTLNNTCTGAPTEYLASESSSFSGAPWKPYSTAPTFTLSAGNVVKTVYFKVRNAAGQVSGAKYDVIVLEEIRDLALNTWYVDEINPLGDSDWFRFTAPKAGMYRIDTFPWILADNITRLYGPNNRTTLIVEDDDSGFGSMARISRTLNPGTYYVKCGAYYWQYNTGPYFISVCQVPPPTIPTFTISNGTITTNRREVLLNNSSPSYPLDYMASESPTFAEAAWQPYSLAPVFTINSAGNGTKTIYFKLRNEAGVSAVKSDTITLQKIPIKVLVVYKADKTGADAMAGWLLGRGLIPTLRQMDTIQLIPQSTLKTYQVLMMGYDTGDGGNWGTPALVNYILQSGRPVLGIGDGGYAFFGKVPLAIGYPKGGHGVEPNITVVDGSHTAYNLPHTYAPLNGLPIALYNNSTTMVGIYLPSIPSGVVPLALQAGQTAHYPFVYQTPRYMLWGFNGPPAAMTTTGQDIFENVVRFTAGMVAW